MALVGPHNLPLVGKGNSVSQSRWFAFVWHNYNCAELRNKHADNCAKVDLAPVVRQIVRWLLSENQSNWQINCAQQTAILN